MKYYCFLFCWLWFSVCSKAQLDTIQCELTKLNLEALDSHEQMGDTISTPNALRWMKDREKSSYLEAIFAILKQGDDFFLIKDNDQQLILGMVDNEVEYIGIYAISIDKKQCQILRRVLIAEETYSENAFKEAYTIVTGDSSFKTYRRDGSREIEKGSRNWLLGTQIKEIEITSTGTFSEHIKHDSLSSKSASYYPGTNN